VIVGPPSRWRQIFVADVTPPAERGPSASERGENPSITLAPEAIAMPDPAANRLQLSLVRGSTYEVGKDVGDYHISDYSGQGDQALYAEKPKAATISKPVTEMDTKPLYMMAYRTPALDKTSKLDAQIELNTRFALPLACILLALAGCFFLNAYWEMNDAGMLTFLHKKKVTAAPAPAKAPTPAPKAS